MTNRCIGTTKTTIQSVRDRSHWNSSNLEPKDPVGLGLCSQIDLDTVVRKAAAKLAKLAPDQPDPGPSLEPTPSEPAKPELDDREKSESVDLKKVFADLGSGDES